MVGEDVIIAIVKLLRPGDKNTVEIIAHPDPKQTWKGLSGYTPVFTGFAMAGGGNGTAVNYTGSGVLMAISHGGTAVSMTLTVDGSVILNNKTVPGGVTYITGFDTSLKVEWANGGAGTDGLVVYLHD